MSLQIFGTKKCKDTQKAERFFKERRVNFHFVNLKEKSISPGELNSIKSKIPVSDLIDKNSKLYEKMNLKYIIHDEEKILLENPLLFKTPIIRYKKLLSLGYKPDSWSAIAEAINCES